MQSIDATWTSIISGRYIVEYKIEIGSDTYTQSDIYGTPQITQSLFDKFSAGNAVAGTLKVTIKPKGVIPQMARLDVYSRVKNATQTSDWIPKGKYYIDTRKLDHNGYLSLECYDAMLKTEYTFMESGSWTQTTALATLGMIASDIGVSVNVETSAVMTGDPKTVEYVPNIGENGTTGREMLRYIGAMYGGSFIIDELGTLKLVQFAPNHNLFDIDSVGIESGAISSSNGKNAPSTTRVRTTGFVPVLPSTQYTLSTNITRVFVLEFNESQSYVNVYSGWQTAPYTFTPRPTTKYIRIVFSYDDSTTIIPSNVEWVQLELGNTATPYVPYQSGVDMGVLASTLDIAPAYDAIDRVIMYGLSGDEGYKSPASTFDTLTGRIFEVTCPWTSQALADDLLAYIEGYVYQPLESTNVPLPPQYQLGDRIRINGTTSVISNEVISLNSAHLCEISAPFEEEVNHEYPYRSPAQRMIEEGVTKEELATAGRTVINGGNIKTGTITLGGDGNGNGILDIVDENDDLCGEWDNTGITIYDNSTLSGYLSTDNKLRILRMGDDPDTAFGTLLGVGLYDDQQTYPDFRRPYITLRGKDTRGNAANAKLDAIAGLTLSSTDQSSNNWSVQLRADPFYVTSPVTRTSGVNPSASLETWGRIAQLTFEFTANATYSANTNIFTGTLVDGYRPRTSILGVGYYGSSVYVGMISPSGTITIRACDSVTFQSNYPAYISWTWIF